MYMYACACMHVWPSWSEVEPRTSLYAEKAGDNSDGKRCDLDNDQAETCPVGAFRTEQEIFREAEKSRKWLGDVFVCLRLLVAHLPEPHLVAGDLLNNLPEVSSYVGADCSSEWLRYLRLPPEKASLSTPSSPAAVEIGAGLESLAALSP